ncbi:MAG: zinc-ribbon domain-containing transport protein [Ruminiclostridium sp.]|nr:zinc-ribbon domain-containing transport protein [Ruminiclostridium sp.]
MNPVLTAILTPIIVIAVIVLVIFIIVMIIKHKLESATRRYLGMGLKETADMLGNGLREEATTPKAISNVSAMYKPKLLRDFPDMSYERFLEMANTALVSILTAIESGNADRLENATDSLKSVIRDRIHDNNGRNLVEHFDDIKLHRTAISDYKTTSDTASADFEISFQCVHFFEGKDNAPDKPSQFAARVTLSYGREFTEDSGSLTFSHNCPNCGAPIYSVGGRMMKCTYCGTGVTEEVYKSWLVSAYKFI